MALQNENQGTGPRVTSRKYSSEIKVQLEPNEKWGSCHIEHNEGYVNIQNYQTSLDLTKAVYLEVYHQNVGEKYCIKYIEVDIDLD